jgi:glycosyltransferase involved in cell wall biosynthesis
MSLPRSVAGAGTYILGLINGLDRLNVAEIYVYCKQRDADLLAGIAPNSVIRALPDFGKARRIYWQQYGLKTDLRRDAIDLFHATHYVVPECDLGIPVIATIHDLAFFHLPHCYPSHKRFFFQRAIKRSVRRADALVTVSETTFRDVTRKFPELPPCYPVPSGLFEVEDWKSNGCVEPPAFPYLLAVATQEKRKNLPFLVSVFSRLIAEFQNLHLILAGQPDNDSGKIRRAIGEYQLHERVLMPGYVPDAELQNLYANASAVCVPSSYEGFGFTVLEGMAARVPVVTSDRPAMTELGSVHITTARYGHAGDWHDRLRRILLHPPSYRELEAAAEHARNYSWGTTARKMIRIYRETIEKDKGNPEAGRIPAGDLRHSSTVDVAVMKTLAFADLFDYPLSKNEIYLGLAEYDAELEEVEMALASLAFSRAIERKDSWYCLAGRSGICQARRDRNRNTTQLLKHNQRMLARICNWPGVHAVALSGAAAFGNCKECDDIDLFLITKKQRLWLVHLSLVIFLKFTGQRRLFCMNYSISEDCVERLTENFFVAHQIAHIRPISNRDELDRYLERQSWIGRYLPQGGMPSPIELPVVCPSQGFFHRIFGARAFNWFDWMIERIYSVYLRRLTRHLGRDSIELSRYKIKLFTNNHIGRITKLFEAKMEDIFDAGSRHGLRAAKLKSEEPA